VPSEVDGVELTGNAPMETDAPENEGPTPLRRTAMDVEINHAIPNADTDSEVHPYRSTTTTLTTLHIPYRIHYYQLTNHNIDTRILLPTLRTPHDCNTSYALRRRRQPANRLLDILISINWVLLWCRLSTVSLELLDDSKGVFSDVLSNP